MSDMKRRGTRTFERKKVEKRVGDYINSKNDRVCPDNDKIQD